MKKVSIFLIFLLLINISYAYEVEYILQDHLGNNIAVTDQEGKVIWKADYEPFGDSFNELNENNNYKYNSKELDDSTGLLYYGARYYDSDIGRFTTPDPVSGSVTNPQSLNRYVYVQNNPLKYIDPTGNEGEYFGPVPPEMVYPDYEGGEPRIHWDMYQIRQENAAKGEIQQISPFTYLIVMNIPTPLLNSVSEGYGRGIKTLFHYLYASGEPMEFKLSENEWEYMLKQTEGKEWKPLSNGGEYMSNIAAGPGNLISARSDVYNLFGTTALKRTKIEGGYAYEIFNEKFDFYTVRSSGFVRYIPRPLAETIHFLFPENTKIHYNLMTNYGRKPGQVGLEVDVRFMQTVGEPFPITARYTKKD